MRLARRGGGRGDPAAKRCLLKCAVQCALPDTVSVAQIEPTATLTGDGEDGTRRGRGPRLCARRLLLPTTHTRRPCAHHVHDAGGRHGRASGRAPPPLRAQGVVGGGWVGPGRPKPRPRHPRRGSARHRAWPIAHRPKRSAGRHRRLLRTASHRMDALRGGPSPSVVGACLQRWGGNLGVAQCCWCVSAAVGREPRGPLHRGRASVARVAARGAAWAFANGTLARLAHLLGPPPRGSSSLEQHTFSTSCLA